MIKLAVEADVDEQLYELYKKCCHLEHFCVSSMKSPKKNAAAYEPW